MDHTEGDTNFNYYHEYCRLHLANVVLMSQMRELVNERGSINLRKKERKSRKDKKAKITEKRGSEELRMKFKDIIDVRLKHAKGHTDRKDH